MNLNYRKEKGETLRGSSIVCGTEVRFYPVFTSSGSLRAIRGFTCLLTSKPCGISRCAHKLDRTSMVLKKGRKKGALERSESMG